MLRADSFDPVGVTLSTCTDSLDSFGANAGANAGSTAAVDSLDSLEDCLAGGTPTETRNSPPGMWTLLFNEHLMLLKK